MKGNHKTSINFSEAKLMNIIDKIIFDENIFLTTNELDCSLGDIEGHIGNLGIDIEAYNDLIDDIQGITDEYARYAYKEGFKEGIRLFYTLIKI